MDQLVCLSTRGYVMLGFACADRSGMASPAIDPTLMASPKTLNDPMQVEDHEVAYLLRHFGETAGQW